MNNVTISFSKSFSRERWTFPEYTVATSCTWDCRGAAIIHDLSIC